MGLIHNFVTEKKGGFVGKGGWQLGSDGELWHFREQFSGIAAFCSPLNVQAFIDLSSFNHI